MLDIENGSFITTVEKPQSAIFTIKSKTNDEILRFENNGEIFVHGKLVENDIQVVEEFREFLSHQGF